MSRYERHNGIPTGRYVGSLLPWLEEFSRYDLYSKSDSAPDADALR